ncbi:hypothetical protein ASD83_10915 [Devosia sp. Root685]|nr:hypothetical protein ASD83_10915 [Devosia sp. Root685]
MLAFALRTKTAEGAQGSCIAATAGIDRVVEDNAAANEGADEEIGVIAKLLAAPIDVLGLAAGRGVVDEAYRPSS